MDQAFIELYKARKLRLHRFFLQHLGSGDYDKAREAMDLVQETAQKALPQSRTPEYRDRCEELMWMVAWNVLLRHCERSKRRKHVYAEVKSMTTSQFIDPIDAYTDRDLWERLCKKIDPVTRRICQLRRHGYSYGEVASELGMTEGKVKMRLRRLKP